MLKGGIMGIIGKVQGKMISPRKAQEKLKDYNYKVGRMALIKGLPKCLRQGYKEQKAKGINPTVDSIFGDISQDNLEFYHKMNITDDYIKGFIKKVIDEAIDK
jgi:hypothetical protein